MLQYTQYAQCHIYVTPTFSTFPLSYKETFSRREIVLRIRVKKLDLVSLVRFLLGVVINGLKVEQTFVSQVNVEIRKEKLHQARKKFRLLMSLKTWWIREVELLLMKLL